MKRIGLYGGSFDPPHVCHVLVATYALCRADIDVLHVIPVHTHAFGKALAPFALRCEMLERSLAHLGPRVVVDQIEARLSPPNYTVDTVAALREELGEDTRFVFVCGTDLFASRHRWKSWETLEDRLDFFVIGRAGSEAPVEHDTETQLPDVSSTEIRRRVAANESIDRLVAPDVLTLIDDHELYRQ